MRLENVFRRPRLERDGGRASRLGDAGGGGAVDIDLRPIANSTAALPNEGMCVLRRTSPSCKRGVSGPGSKPNSSSRGEKPAGAGRADPVTSVKRELLTTVGE